MTDDRDRRPPETLEVPVARVDASGGHDRRNRLAALAVVAFAVAVVAVALPGALADDRSSRSPAPSEVAAASAPTLDPTPDRTARPGRAPRPSLAIPPLPSIPTRELEDAPRLAFYKRSGDDVEILAWSAGRADLEAVGRIEDALAGIGENEPVVMTSSPDGRSVFIQSYGSFDTGDPSPVVLASLDGGIRWTSATSETGQPIWSEDARWLVFGTGGRWFLIDTAADPVAVREAAVATFLRDGRSPAPSPGGPVVPASDAVPLGVSRDGRWAYGAEMLQGGNQQRALRVDLVRAAVERIDEIPRSGPAAPPSGYGLAAVDGLTGRYVDFDEIGDQIMSIREADGETAFTLETGGSVQSIAWLDDGRLAIVEGGDLEPGGSMRIYHVLPDGTAEQPVFELENLPNSGLFMNDRRDHVIVAIIQERNDRALLVMVRLVDGAASTLNLDLSDVSRVHTIGWLEGSPG